MRMSICSGGKDVVMYVILGIFVRLMLNNLVSSVRIDDTTGL